MKAQLLSPQTQADLNSQRGVNGIREVTRKVNLGQNSLTYNLQQSHTFHTDIRNKRFRRKRLELNWIACLDKSVTGALKTVYSSNYKFYSTKTQYIISYSWLVT